MFQAAVPLVNTGSKIRSGQSLLLLYVTLSIKESKIKIDQTLL